MYARGQETGRGDNQSFGPAYEDVKAARARCRKNSALDLATYAPSVRVESDLERIDLGGGRVVYARRKKRDAVWSQQSRRAEESDKILRQRLIEQVKQTPKS